MAWQSSKYFCVLLLLPFSKTINHQPVSLSLLGKKTFFKNMLKLECNKIFTYVMITLSSLFKFLCRVSQFQHSPGTCSMLWNSNILALTMLYKLLRIFSDLSFADNALGCECQPFQRNIPDNATRGVRKSPIPRYTINVFGRRD